MRIGNVTLGWWQVFSLGIVLLLIILLIFNALLPPTQNRPETELVVPEGMATTSDGSGADTVDGSDYIHNDATVLANAAQAFFYAYDRALQNNNASLVNSYLDSTASAMITVQERMTYYDGYRYTGELLEAAIADINTETRQVTVDLLVQNASTNERLEMTSQIDFDSNLLVTKISDLY